MAPSWRSPLALALTLLGLVVFCQGSETSDYMCYKYSPTAKGAIKPDRDINVEVGSSYEASCLLNPAEGENVDDVYFEAKRSEDRRRIDHTVVNNSTIKIQMTHQEPTRYLLQCWRGFNEENREFICERTVFVGYKPKDVENFTCISKNFQTLNCTWDTPENPVKVNYSLKYVIHGFYSRYSDCPKAGKNWCYWDRMKFHGSHQDWTMIINATNKLADEPVEFRHEVDVYSTVLPDPATNFKVEVLGPREVNLTWKLPHPIDVFTDGRVLQEVKYRILPIRNMYTNSPWVEVDKWKVSPPPFDRILYTKVISNLKPYVNYEFSVRLHTGTGPEREEMWSKPVRLEERTAAEKPAVAPLTTLGMFEVEETKSHRDVTVNWQAIDPLEESGSDFGFEVKIYDTRSASPVRPPSTTPSSYMKFPGLENNIEYRFEIRPKNGEGLPEAPDVMSVIMVPKTAALISTPQYFKVISYPGSDTTTYMLRWRLPDHRYEGQSIETATLYWCKQSEYEKRCVNKIEWVTTDEPHRHVRNLTGFDPSSRYIFGISVNSQNSSSGIKWSGCIATHGEQQPALETFDYTYVNSTDLKLHWRLDCKAEAAQPSAFNISYCIAENHVCAEPEEYVTVDGESTVEYVIRNLHPYRQYLFYIATISDLGLGKWSRSLPVRTLSAKHSGPPQNIRVLGRSQTWISLDWDPPRKEHQNGEIAPYSIKYYRAGHTQPYSKEDSFPPVNFTDLDPFTNYTFEVSPCTRVSGGITCGSSAARIAERTKIGVPGKIDSLIYDAPQLEWDHEECNGPSCSYRLHYTVNDTSFNYDTPPGQTVVTLQDLNISCPVKNGEVPVRLRAVSTDEEGHQLLGPTVERKVTCPSKALAWWIIVIIVVISIIVAVVVFSLFSYSREQVSMFIKRVTLQPNLPSGLDPHLQSSPSKRPWYKPWPKPGRETIAPSTPPFKSSEEQDLIKPGSERHFSGDSGTSVADPADSSGCSTGGDSVSSSGSDRVPPSSDSGTVQEEAGFPSEQKKWGSVRLRPSYVMEGLPEKVPNMKGYVSLGSVPNLSGTAVDGVSPLQQSNPTLGLDTLPEVRMGGRRTSTGYISMPTNESDGISFPLDDLGNLVLPHERRPGDYLAYSRHYMPYKKTTDFSPYTKAQSLPWLNTGYVAVAQAEDGGQPVPGAQGYVAVGDAMNVMKRQPSLPSLPMDASKALITPDEDLPPGAYCKLGARGSPDPPPTSHGYVSETQHMPVPTSLDLSPPVYKSPYVTCAMAESMASPKKEPRKAADYVSVGDMTDGHWAYPIMHPTTPEETREVLSAPVESTRSRTMQPVRPNSSETNHNRRSSQFAPTGHSLSKQSSGYASGNVSQETLAFHDPLLMSPKKLLARSHEPHSVVYSPNHKPSMV